MLMIKLHCYFKVVYLVCCCSPGLATAECRSQRSMYSHELQQPVHGVEVHAVNCGCLKRINNNNSNTNNNNTLLL